MAIKLPLVLDSSGNIQQLQAADTISTGIELQELEGTVGQLSGTTQIPYNNNAPLITGGTQIWTATLTPSKIGSLVKIDFSTIIDTSAINLAVTIAIFRGSTLIGFCTTSSSAYNGQMPAAATIKLMDTTTSLSPVTYTCRAGISANGTWYLGRGSNGTMGGTNPSAWLIRETL